MYDRKSQIWSCPIYVRVEQNILSINACLSAPGSIFTNNALEIVTNVLKSSWKAVVARPFPRAHTWLRNSDFVLNAISKNEPETEDTRKNLLKGSNANAVRL